MTVLGTYNSIVIILISILLSGIENGFDITARDYEISENLKAGLTIFIIFSIVSLIVFHQVLSSIKL
jgi:hypothetical protein